MSEARKYLPNGNDFIEPRKWNLKLKQGNIVCNIIFMEGLTLQGVIVWKDQLLLEAVIKMGLKTVGLVQSLFTKQILHAFLKSSLLGHSLPVTNSSGKINKYINKTGCLTDWDRYLHCLQISRKLGNSIKIHKIGIIEIAKKM